MNPELTNNGLQPPDSLHDKEFGYEDELNSWIEVIKRDFKPEEIFDLYNHDREVAIAFKTFVSRYMNGDIVEEEPNKGIGDAELWELFCKNKDY